MKKKLIINGIIKMLSGIILMGLLLFIPAGTFEFPGAWRMIAVLFIPMFILGSVLFMCAPSLLEKRLNTKETEKEQKSVILLSTFMFIAAFVLSGLDFRFGWSYVPIEVSAIGCVIFLLTYLCFAKLLKENEFLSRTVEVQDNQHVVDTGLYSVVRHPMYSIILFMFLSMPLIIGSYIGLIPLVFLPFILVKRILNEEKVLSDGLTGYQEYMKKVKYRMIPFIW